MNDFREYQSAFLDHQDDLMHYGVKGMKWEHRKRSPGEKKVRMDNIDALTMAEWREKYARLRRNAMKKKAKQAAEERRKKK